MFNCLPGAMLHKGHTHQWKKGFSCSRVLSQHNARMTASHRLFNPGPQVAKLEADSPAFSQKLAERFVRKRTLHSLRNRLSRKYRDFSRAQP